MADDQQAADEGTCYRCGEEPPGSGGVLCTSCFEYLKNQPPSEIYAKILEAAA